jgi:hypothetical protein
MQPPSSPPGPPEYNVLGFDYVQRSHLRYRGPLIDVHTHIIRTRPGDPRDGAPGSDAEPSMAQAETMLAVAAEFGVTRCYSMCPPDDIPPLRERFGDRLAFNGPIAKGKRDEPDDAVFRRLDRFLELGVEIIKFWAAPRGRERGLLVDAPWRIEAARRAQAAGVRAVMVHVADPDVWFRRDYVDVAKFGAKLDQYTGLERLLGLFPGLTFIAAHMGGDPEHADHLESLLEKHPNLYLDTSATKWQVREVSAHHEAIRALICRHPRRFLFGSDLVTRHALVREHYISRYWCQRTLWESNWQGRSPIADADYTSEPGGPPTPQLVGLELPKDLLDLVYHANVERLFYLPMPQPA